MQKFTSTKLFKIIIIVIIFAGLIFLNPYKFFNPVRSGFGLALLPFQKVLYSFSIGFENTKDFISSIGKLKSENEKLIRENQQLISENAMLNDMRNENTVLREQINLLPRNQYNLIAAFVASQDPNGMGNWLEIDKGSDDGIAEGMSVIVSKGIFIGRIQDVSSHKSQVMLLTNPKSTVNVITTNSGAKGVIKGEYGLGIMLDMVLQTDSINVGDSVVTSGISGDVPRGLYVGAIQEIHQSDDHLFQQAVIASPLQIAKNSNRICDQEHQISPYNMKKKFIYIIIILVAIILQTSLFSVILNTNAAGDIVLMAILALSVLDGFSAFLGWAIAAGILYDLAAYATIGEHVLVFLLVVYFVSFFSRRFPTDLKGIGLFLFIIFVIIATFVSRGIFALAVIWDSQTLQGYWEAFGNFSFISLSIIYNEILFFIWFIVLKKIKKFFDI